MRGRNYGRRYALRPTCATAHPGAPHSSSARTLRLASSAVQDLLRFREGDEERRVRNFVWVEAETQQPELSTRDDDIPHHVCQRFVEYHLGLLDGLRIVARRPWRSGCVVM